MNGCRRVSPEDLPSIKEGTYLLTWRMYRLPQTFHLYLYAVFRPFVQSKICLLQPAVTNATMTKTHDDHKSVLRRYYASLESRIGYQLFLGGTRHFGYYPNSHSWPLPIGRSLRAMEGSLFKALQCSPGSRVLDAGCGFGHVALYMAEQGQYKVEAIDFMARHAARAQSNVEKAGMRSAIKVRQADYHHLEFFDNASFDGIYTMETLVHSTDPLGVLKGFHRLLKPGGRIAMNEYDHEDLDKAPKEFADAMRKVNTYSAMPANASFNRDELKSLLIKAGFVDVELRDLSEHIVPMLWLFYIFAIIPYTIFKLLGLECHFVNTIAGVYSYKGRSIWRYVQVTGKKAA